MKDWTLALKQFLSNRKKELPQIFCSCLHLDFLIFWPQQIRLCVVLAQYHRHLPFFFFFHLFIFLPAKPKFLQFHLNWIVYPFALSSHTHETLPHLDFVSGKPLSILIPVWAQQNSQTHLDLGMWLQQNFIIIINNQPLVKISCVIFIQGNSTSLCLGIGLGLERCTTNSLSCQSVPAWCLFLMVLGLLPVQGILPPSEERPLTRLGKDFR